MRLLSKRLFISKNASEIDPFRSQFTELGFDVEAHSFLSFSGVAFEVAHAYDVIFFGSPRAVIFFKAGSSIREGAAIACIGAKTAELLRSMGHVVSFCGEKSGDPGVVGREFLLFVRSRTATPFREAQHGAIGPRVLFPVSDRSLGTISGVIPEDQKEVVVVYSTEVKGKLVGLSDVYVFTSPSNVDGYLLENSIPKGAQVVAWGKSTEGALRLKGVEVDFTLGESGFEELIGWLKE